MIVAHEQQAGAIIDDEPWTVQALKSSLPRTTPQKDGR
jgi:hypothetical protein